MNINRRRLLGWLGAAPVAAPLAAKALANVPAPDDVYKVGDRVRHMSEGAVTHYECVSGKMTLSALPRYGLDIDDNGHIRGLVEINPDGATQFTVVADRFVVPAPTEGSS